LNVKLVRLGASHALSSFPLLLRYLINERPLALLAAKDRANRVALMANMLAGKITGKATRVVTRLGTTVTAALKEDSRIISRLRYLPMRLVYPLADEIVAVSQGVADDLASITGLSAQNIRVIANPVITSGLESSARAAVQLPWPEDDTTPMIVGAGRLTRQKDFPTLIRAFAGLRMKRPCRLMILGEGKDRQALEDLIDALGLADDVRLPGFVENPYAYIRRASLFVLSSRWEGSPNVLTEALALGVPVVATDCPSGPVEILQGGRYGRLVPMGDVDRMTDAMQATLDHPPEPSFLKQAVRAYTVENSSRRYLEVLLGTKWKTFCEPWQP
jgi:glycosyltransferase involved in cell wall biosynthesis